MRHKFMFVPEHKVEFVLHLKVPLLLEASGQGQP